MYVQPSCNSDQVFGPLSRVIVMCLLYSFIEIKTYCCPLRQLNNKKKIDGDFVQLTCNLGQGPPFGSDMLQY